MMTGRWVRVIPGEEAIPTPPLLAFVDCETTGLDPEQHEVWEVALVRWDQRERAIVSQHVWQLPVDVGRADPVALTIGGFADRRWPPSELCRCDDFAGEFAWLVKGCPLVGANPAFDAEFLRRVMLAAGGANPWHYRVVDVEAMAFGYAYGYSEGRGGGPGPYVPEKVPWSSTDLSEAIGVVRDPASMHTALGDVLWCVQLWKAMTAWAAS